ncbi:MAG TPA: EF-P lysine aminoacylase EpmA [Planctomycetaceae bacterium]|jgi:lysyl-tRNA synthetase class 2|nr:EF-P lysine aminoacylase EpmA [Planctomycetaceae bacterium]
MTSNESASGRDPGLFKPSAELERLQLRSKLLDFTRSYFRDRGLWEAETPLLSRDIVVDAYLEPFTTRRESRSECRPPAPDDELFLQTSPEFAMKRLLAAGASDIFQLTRSFRRGEIGRLHNPEFTILEWYQVGATYHDEMRFVEEFVSAFFDEVNRLSGASHVDSPTAIVRGIHERLPRPFLRSSYDELFRGALGTTVLDKTAAELSRLADRMGIAPPPGLDADDLDGWLNLLLAIKAEPELSRQAATFIYDYPAGQAALARIRGDVPPVAERFELYLSGIEICNGYQELTDPQELKRRIVVQQTLRRREGSRPLPADSWLFHAMEAGLPQCAGVALGFDRLLMAAIGAQSLSEVIAFPFDRA